jgi:hypothetical protein
MTKYGSSVKRHLFRLPILLTCLVIAVASLMPLMDSQHASAAGQITSRSLTLSSAVPGDTNVRYSFSFTIPSTSQVQSLKFLACTTAVGTYDGGSCTPPTGMTGSDGFFAAAWLSQSGWQGATNFATDPTGANDCTASASVICATRTDTTSQTATSRTIVFNGIKNPTTANTAFFVGMTTYDDVAWTHANIVDFGATASAVVQTLTTYAAVAEVLQFCVGSTTVDDADTTLIANDCAGVSGTSVNIGTLDTTQINISPVLTNGGDSHNGVAMIRTNASNGATVAYRPIPASTGTQHLATLRISGGTCIAGGGVFTDPCINAQGGTQGTFTPGNENFGMTIAGVNCEGTSSYTCTFAGGTYNLVPQTNYVGKAGNAYCIICNTADSGNGFAWDESGTPVVIASSASSTIKQIDDEALVLKFAATPQITTPFGPYSVQTDFIAVPTY